MHLLSSNTALTPRMHGCGAAALASSHSRRTCRRRRSGRSLAGIAQQRPSAVGFGGGATAWGDARLLLLHRRQSLSLVRCRRGRDARAARAHVKAAAAAAGRTRATRVERAAGWSDPTVITTASLNTPRPGRARRGGPHTLEPGLGRACAAGALTLHRAHLAARRVHAAPDGAALRVVYGCPGLVSRPQQCAASAVTLAAWRAQGARVATTQRGARLEAQAPVRAAQKVRFAGGRGGGRRAHLGSHTQKRPARWALARARARRPLGAQAIPTPHTRPSVRTCCYAALDTLTQNVGPQAPLRYWWLAGGRRVSRSAGGWRSLGVRPLGRRP